MNHQEKTANPFHLLEQGKWEDVIRITTERLRQNPNEGVTYYARGRAYVGKGDYEPAIKDFNTAIEKKCELAEVYAQRGYCYAKTGNHDLAMVNYNLAIEKDPKAAEAYANRGHCHDAQGDHESAMADYNRAIKVNPQFYGGYYNRGVSLLDKGEYAAAIDDFNRTLEIEPNHAAAIHNRSAALVQKDAQERLDKFQQEFEEDFVQGDEERAREAMYSRKLRNIERLILITLALLGIGLFGVFHYFLSFVLDKNGKMPAEFLPFGLMGLVFPTALLVSPLVWWIRTLLRDKAKYTILREDAARKRRVMRYVLFERKDPVFRKEVILKSLDHWTRQSAADLLVDFENKRTVPSASSAPEIKLPQSGDKGE